MDRGANRLSGGHHFGQSVNVRVAFGTAPSANSVHRRNQRIAFVLPPVRIVVAPQTGSRKRRQTIEKLGTIHDDTPEAWLHPSTLPHSRDRICRSNKNRLRIDNRGRNLSVRSAGNGRHLTVEISAFTLPPRPFRMLPAGTKITWGAYPLKDLASERRIRNPTLSFLKEFPEWFLKKGKHRSARRKSFTARN